MPTFSEERAREVAAEFSIPRAFGGYRRLIELPDIDLVSVCVPPFKHCDCTVDALLDGKHVLCEKPMAMKGAASAEMIAAAEESGKNCRCNSRLARPPGQAAQN